MTQTTPEIGKSIRAGGVMTNYHEAGSGTPVILIHGREDQVIPLISSQKLLQVLDNAQLHIFGHCGHWTQIEHPKAFNRLVRDFLTEGTA
jgi:pimeloyl-ACP methyl ester carboxylesterase